MHHEKCQVCLASPESGIKKYACIDGVDYYECGACGSIYAGQKLNSSGAADVFNYDQGYWNSEMSAAKQRSFGASVNRCAELFFYSRIPIRKFLDIGTGPGYLLDALAVLMPDHKAMFYGVELYPPPGEYRSNHRNYIVGDLANIQDKFSGGVCIEVIEHLHPAQLRAMVGKLARLSETGALYYFNSGQPDFVKNEDPGYLDPLNRGHIVAYSIAGLSQIFSEYGFTIIPLPGRSWGFLAKFSVLATIPSADDLLNWIWNAHPDNIDKLKINGFGHLMHAIGLESARCYLEHAIADERTKWARSLL